MDIKKLIDEYTSWLKSEITFEQFGEYYEITTPYLDNANDYLQLYVKQDGDTIFFTDDCVVMHGLKMSGFQFTKARKEHLNRVLQQYGIQLNGDELIAKTNIKNFAQKKHLFIQAMLRIDDMFSMSKSKVSSFFLDDVQDFFSEHDIFYSDNVQFTGTSGFSHSYDFLFQRTKTKPERLCQTLNNPTVSNTKNILFAWNDTKPVRKNNSQLIVILNDQNKISKDVEEAFLNYDAHILRWSERNKPSNIDLFSA